MAAKTGKTSAMPANAGANALAELISDATNTRRIPVVCPGS